MFNVKSVHSFSCTVQIELQEEHRIEFMGQIKNYRRKYWKKCVLKQLKPTKNINWNRNEKKTKSLIERER